MPGLRQAQLRLHDPAEALVSSTIELMLERARAAEKLWYENALGDCFVPKLGESHLAPEPYIFQKSRFPAILRESTLLVRNGRSTTVVATEFTYSSELVLALCRPLHREQEKQLARYGSVMLPLDFDHAVIAAVSCERCINALAHRAGLDWGYAVGSREWVEARTGCKLCQVE